MHKFAKHILVFMVGLSAWEALAQPVTLSPTSAVIYVNDTVEFTVFCPDGYGDAHEWPAPSILSPKTIRAIGMNTGSGPSTIVRTFEALRPGSAKINAYCGLYKVPEPVPTATLTVLAKGNGKGRLAPTSLSIPVGVSSQFDFRCDGGARPAVFNAAADIAAMTVTGSQATITGLREGRTGITLTCDTVEAATAPVTVTPTAASIAQVAYDKAKSENGTASATLSAAVNALEAARANYKAAVDAQKRAADALAAALANCRSVPGCVVR